MKKESNSLIISIVAVLVIALIGFNFEEITGQATGQTNVKVTPLEINAGEYITVNINPSGCVNNLIGVYDDSDLRRSTFSSSLTGRSNKICEPFEVSFKTYPSWKPSDEQTGLFFVKVFDYNSEEFVSKPFTIKR